MSTATNRKNGLEKILWSITLPGFGQLLNQKYFKGLLLIVLEIMINVNSNLNQVICSSFYCNMEEAILKTNFEWLMFYPSIYCFAIWDAYRDAVEEHPPFFYIPIVMAAYTSTLGVLFSEHLKIMGAYIGPIFLPTIFALLGLGLGFIIRAIILKYWHPHEDSNN